MSNLHSRVVEALVEAVMRDLRSRSGVLEGIDRPTIAIMRGELTEAIDAALASELADKAIVPREAPDALLISMACRMNHGFGLEDADQQRSEIRTMRQVHEEVVGTGFYHADGSTDARYRAMLAAAGEGK